MRETLLVLILWAGLGGSQEIPWLKLDQAKAVGASTGKLILVFVACDPGTGRAPCSGGAAERAFSDPAIQKRGDQFLFVRVVEKKTAMAVRASKAPEAIFLDAEGDELYRSGFGDGASLDRAMAAALEVYAPREAPWAAALPTAPSGKQLLVVAFDDEKGEFLKPFEDKSLVKYHERFDYVRLGLKKDAETAKKWGVSQPTMLFFDGTREPSEKNAIEKLTGKKTPAALKAAIQKALAKLEPPKK